MTAAIEHRFATGGARRVMMRRAGSGPPVLLLHESPRSSAAFVPMIEALADRFTVIAPDTPGYGGSDPLPLRRPRIADYAEATAEMLGSLGIERAALFGRHTGAAIALSFANRYPGRTAGVVLEGCPVFAPHEMEELVANYLPPFRPVWDGSHVAWLWSRIRDQFSFFPWYRQGPASRLAMDMPRPSILNRIATDFLLAGDGYRVAYEAAFRHDGAAAAADVRVPAHFIATETDVLFAHLDRLPPLPGHAHVHRLTEAGRMAAVKQLLTGLADGEAPAPAPPGEDGARRFVQIGGSSLLVRQWGAGTARPLLLVADLPGSSRQLAPIAAHLAKHRRVVAIDPPGHGFSSAAPPERGDGVVDPVARAVEALGLARFDLAGIGIGACGAARLAALSGSGADRLVLIDPPPDPTRFARHESIDLVPCRSGSHLLAAWHMVRDSLLYRPWFASTRATRRAVEIGIDVHALHERFVDTVVSGPAFARTCRALCERPWPALLEPTEAEATIVVGDAMPDAREQAALAAGVGARVVEATGGACGYARAIMAAVDAR